MLAVPYPLDDPLSVLPEESMPAPLLLILAVLLDRAPSSSSAASSLPPRHLRLGLTP